MHWQKFRCTFFIIMASLLSLTSAEEGIPFAELLLPRSLHATWIYKSYVFQEGKWIPSGSLKEKVVGSKKINGQICWQIMMLEDHRNFWQKVSGKLPDQEDFVFYWEYNTLKGSYNFIEWGHVGFSAPEHLSDFEHNLPYPVQKGDRYTAEGADWLVVETDQEISVPAGRFSCIVYQAGFEDGGEGFRNRIYIAKGTGVVRTETEFLENGKWILQNRSDLLRVYIPQPTTTELPPSTAP